jgi:hypothetical protein
MTGKFSVEISEHQFKRLREFEEISGSTIQNQIHDALEDWIECSVRARLEVLAERSAQS